MRTESTCSVPGCGGAAGIANTARGMCLRHYRHWLRHGDPERKRPVSSIPTDTKLAWAAGFIDGEGCIGIMRNSEPRSSHKTRHQVRMWVVNTVYEPLAILQELFGGSIALEGRHRSFQAQWKSKWLWSLTSENARDCAELLLPHLVIKHRQAEIVTKFYSEALWSKGGVDRRTPDAEFERREQLVTQIRKLNKRGRGER